MSERTDKPFQESLRQAFKNNRRPVSLELAANIYADLSNIRDMSMELISLLISLSESQEHVDLLKKFAEQVYAYQDNLGKGMELLLSEGREATK
ncbi:hypothetical protein ATY78_18350 [Rhizobium sp. R635]|uniref:hypothetical protein n=1 Tax=Rhizobium sp. R635 TaxID=1764275 RepID=UPI000B537F5B|nr:hypothetical protein [Rhizobium sp. R635]OWV89852.1 hypothetical protein ATY78_18350 [Rhizobium sp. R635]